MDTEHRTAAAEKVLRSAYRGIQIPQKEFVKLLEASVHIQNITNQVNLLIINAAAEAVYTGQDDFAIAVNEVRKLVNESGNQSKIISETLEALT